MTIKYLIDKLDELANGEPWFGASGKSILDSVNEPNVGLTGGNTVGQILEHTLQWKRFVIEKASGNDEFDIVLGSADDWSKGKQYSVEEFEDLKRRYFTLNEQLIEVLSTKTDKWLETIVPGKKSDFATVIDGVIDHDIAHLAQMSALKRAK